MAHDFISIEMDEIITEIDKKRILKINDIKNTYFQPITLTREQLFSKSNKIGKTVATSILILLLIIILITRPEFLILTGPILFFTVIIRQYRKSKIKFKYIDRHVKLKKSFFIKKLKENDLEINHKEMKYYNNFLTRYIDYAILKKRYPLSKKSRNYFEKDYTDQLNSEELFASAILFKNKYDLLKSGSYYNDY